MNQHFKGKGIECIINTQYSKIGNAYPRIFIKAGTSYHNVDLILGTSFAMSKTDWDSWFDENLEELEIHEKIVEALNNVGLKGEEFLSSLEQIAVDEGLI